MADVAEAEVTEAEVVMVGTKTEIVGVACEDATNDQRISRIVASYTLRPTDAAPTRTAAKVPKDRQSRTWKMPASHVLQSPALTTTS